MKFFYSLQNLLIKRRNLGGFEQPKI